MSHKKCEMNNVAKKINQFIFCNDNICKIKRIPKELESAVGKIRNVIPTGPFKDQLLLRMRQVRDMLRRGFITEALAIITTVIEQLNYKYLKRTPKTGALLVIGDLMRLKNAILNSLDHCIIDEHFDQLVTLFQEHIQEFD